MIENKYIRRYFRIKPDGELNAEITIVQVEGRKVNVGYSTVRIHNICPGGLKFSSKLNFPVDSQLILKFKIRTLGQVIQLKGYVAHKLSGSDGDDINEYGICFTEINEQTRSKIVKLFNNNTVRSRNYVIVLRLN